MDFNKIYHKFLTIVVIVLLGLSFIGYLGEYFWLFELVVHFRFQYLFVSFGLLFLTSYHKKLVLILLNLLLIFINFWEISALQIPQPRPFQSRPDFTVLHINVLNINQSYELIEKEIKHYQPDMLFLQEFTEDLEEHLKVLKKGYPYQKLLAKSNSFGIAIYSKLPLDSVQILVLDDSNRPSILAQIEIKKKKIHILSTHPPPPISFRFFAERDELFRKIIQMRSQFGANFILIGDLNITSFSPIFKKLLKQTGLRDSRQGFGLQNTFPATNSLLRIGIDHCLVSHKISVLKREVGRNVGSNHLPIYLELVLRD